MKVSRVVADTEWRPSPAYGRDRPRVSVLLPATGALARGRLRATARSVLAQELDALELIVVDDATAGDAADEVAELASQDERVHCLRHPGSVGLPAIAEYEGYLRARAERVAFVFEGDELQPGALGGLLAAAEEGGHPVVHGYIQMTPREETEGPMPKAIGFGHAHTPQALLKSHPYIPDTAVLLHRRVLETVGLYDPHVCMAGLCGWDLLRRIADHYQIHPVDIEVGKVWGLGAGAVPGGAVLTEPWLGAEWMSRDRNERLRPGRFEDYDVCAVPDDLSEGARAAIEEAAALFRSKCWFMPEDAKAPGPPPEPDGQILVVTSGVDATTTLYFGQLPAPWAGRVRTLHQIIGPDGLPEEMNAASAVVFVRALFSFEPWIEIARRQGVPCYYFVDDNMPLLASEYREYADYGEDALRRRLEPFSGVLVSTRALLEDFAARRLHPRLVYFPPVARMPADDEAAAAPSDPGRVRVGFFGGTHRTRAFESHVLPAIRDVGGRLPLELVVVGAEPGSFDAGPATPVTYLPYEMSYDLALRRLAARRIDILVHPNGVSGNNRFKTLHVLINAMALGAAPVLSDGPPCDVLAGRGVALLCPDDPASWAAAIERLARDPATRARLGEAVRGFCATHYSGRDNVDALRKLLAEHSSPGPVLRDLRFRKTMAALKRGPAGAPLGPASHALLPVPLARCIDYRMTPVEPTLSGLSTLIGSMGATVSGSVELQIIDPDTLDVVRRSTVAIRDLAHWSEFTFSFEALDVDVGRELVARFVPATDAPVTLFETSTHGKTLRRRILRKMRLDRWGRDLKCTVR